MANEIVLDIDEWTNFINRLNGNSKKAILFLKAFAATEGFADIIKHFDNENSSSGRWVPRSQETQERYSKINSGLWKKPKGSSQASFNPSNKLLQLTGRLRQSLNPGQGSVQIKGTDSVLMRAGTNYSSTHDLGDSSRNIPQREFMWLSDSAKQRMVDYIIKSVLG